MILTCPVCHTRYRVDEQALGGTAGRVVRCAGCGHTWHQAAPAREHDPDEPALSLDVPRSEPPPDTSPRPPPAPRLALAPRSQPSQAPPSIHGARVRGWVAPIVLLVLIALVVVVGIAARRPLVAMWPSTARLYALVGLPVEPSATGLVIGKIAPSRTADGLLVEGEIANLGNTPRDVPQLRVTLQDAAEKEVQFEVVDPPKARLSPGEVEHFKTPFAHPADAATGVVVTFVQR